MGWVTDDGMHEGYLVAQFFDGQLAQGVSGGGVARDAVVSGPAAQQPDGSWVYPVRPAGEVTGWTICCSCTDPHGGYTTWTGPTFVRVPSKALEDLRGLKLYAVDEDVTDVGDRDDVQEFAVDIWGSEHAFAQQALNEVRSASRDVAEARARLDTAVGIARSGGASWADIGRAAGITRQAAQERWRPGD